MPRGPSQPAPKQPKRTIAEILADAQDTLETARFGLADLHGSDPRRRLPGLRNLIVFGRAVTNVLQNLKSATPEFQPWYVAKEAEMRDDELMRFFYKLRSEVLKTGKMGPLSTSMTIDHLDSGDLARLMSNPPPGASAFFMGDHLGGSGWTIPFPDGNEESYYVALPDDIGSRVKFAFHFRDAPQQHRAVALEDNSAEALGAHYFSYLEGLLIEARAIFG